MIKIQRVGFRGDNDIFKPYVHSPQAPGTSTHRICSAGFLQFSVVELPFIITMKHAQVSYSSITGLNLIVDGHHISLPLDIVPCPHRIEESQVLERDAHLLNYP